MTASPRVIGVDWGTSNCRAYRFGDDGRVLDSAAAPRGMRDMAVDDYPAVLASLLGEWLAPAPDLLILCGMVGARGGWREVPYVRCPTRLDRLGTRCERFAVPGLGEVAITPGLASGAGQALPDVMRGEETQLVGCLALGGRRDLTALLPGTHSKWVQVVDAEVRGFRTFMTGELHELLSRHSILARSVGGRGDDERWFARGVERARERHAAGAGGFGLLFTVRAEDLLGNHPDYAARAYLSGLLIGAEILEGLALTRAQGTDAPVLLYGAAQLAARYARAFAVLGEPVETIAGDATVRGLWDVACQHLGRGARP